MGPTSLVSRFSNFEPSVEAVYDQGRGTLRESAIEKWKELNERFEFVPVRVTGFKRVYSIPTEKGGTMLELYESGLESDWVNGMLIYGLSQREFEQVRESEEPYDVVNYEKQVEVYGDDGSIEDGRVQGFRTFISQRQSPPDPRNLEPNLTYHQRIVKGIDLALEDYPDVVIEQFKADFRSTTYTPVEIEGDWRYITIAEASDSGIFQ